MVNILYKSSLLIKWRVIVGWRGKGQFNPKQLTMSGGQEGASLGCISQAVPNMVVCVRHRSQTHTATQPKDVDVLAMVGGEGLVKVFTNKILSLSPSLRCTP